MANLNLGQDVANKRERKMTIAHIVSKSHPLSQATLQESSLRFSYKHQPLCFPHKSEMINDPLACQPLKGKNSQQENIKKHKSLLFCGQGSIIRVT